MKSWIGLFIVLFIVEELAHAGRIKRRGDKPHECDDGKHGIGIDLHGDRDWKCMEDKWQQDEKYRTEKKCYNEENAFHVCIDRPIDNLYKGEIPHSGPHREVWAQYGEYNYLPPGRYVHNLEHGGVVFMYHPCAPAKMVEKLRQTATTCLYRYIVTAFPKLSKEYPFAVITYGCIFRMSHVDPSEIKQWIRQQFGKSPEPDEFGNGKYNFGLLVPSADPGSYDYNDGMKQFCPDDGDAVEMSNGEPIADTQVSSVFTASLAEREELSQEGSEGREKGVRFPADTNEHRQFKVSSMENGWFATTDQTDRRVDSNDQGYNGENNDNADIATRIVSEKKGESTVSHPKSTGGTIQLHGSDKNKKWKDAQMEDIPNAHHGRNDNTALAVGSASSNEPEKNDMQKSAVIVPNADSYTDTLQRISLDDTSVRSATVPSNELTKGNPEHVQTSQQTSVFLWCVTSVACFATGLVLGVCIMNLRQRRVADMKKYKVWSDRDSADSFSIAAVVRKIPDTFSNRKPNDDYHRLEPNDQSSDEDNPI